MLMFFFSSLIFGHLDGLLDGHPAGLQAEQHSGGLRFWLEGVSSGVVHKRAWH